METQPVYVSKLFRKSSKEDKILRDRKVSRVYTHCEYCGEPLPFEEMLMCAANHRECWAKAIEEERNKGDREHHRSGKDLIDPGGVDNYIEPTRVDW